jgi:hypothetical protein
MATKSAAILDHCAVRNTTADIREYVEAFKTSADRSRYAVYVLMVVTVVLLIADHNLDPDGWPRRRMRTWYTYERQLVPHYEATNDRLPKLSAPKDIVEGDPLRLAALRDEYTKQFVSRALFNASPLPGVSIDANDTGLVGGIALTMLLLVVVFCLSREHENLYLALYKVRQIAKEEKEDARRGDSCANLLYHALAMNQILGAPPTLARWQRRGVLNQFWFLLLAPFGVQATILRTSWKTRSIASAYGVSLFDQFLWPTLLAVAILMLCIAAMLQSRAMSMRWKRVFFTINPHLRHVEQMSGLEWLKVRRPSAEETAARQVAAEIVQHLSGPITQKMKVPIVPVTVEDVRLPITRNEMRTISGDIVRRGRAAAGVESVLKSLRNTDAIGYFEVGTSRIDATRSWITSGSWVFHVHPDTAAPTSKKDLPPASDRSSHPIIAGTAAAPVLEIARAPVVSGDGFLPGRPVLADGGPPRFEGQCRTQLRSDPRGSGGLRII